MHGSCWKTWLIATAVAAFAILSIGAEASHATSKVSAIPGEIRLEADPEVGHTFLIRDSRVQRDPQSTNYGVLLSTGAITAEEIVWGGIAVEYFAAAAAALAFLTLARELARDHPGDFPEADHVLIMTDLSGNPIQIEQGSERQCRQQVRTTTGTTLPGPSGQPVLSNTVTCQILKYEPNPRIPEDMKDGMFTYMGDKKSDQVIFGLVCLPVNCFSKQIVFAGGGDDYIWGSIFSDELFGEGGSDRIWGGGPSPTDNDLINGGSSHPNARGVLGDTDFEPPPRLGGIPDNDRLYGQGGRDIIYGGYGNDLVAGGAGDDNRTMMINSAAPYPAPAFPLALNGGSGNDVVVGGRGSDRMEGGPDRDAILARETDFGAAAEEVDTVADCGQNLFRPVAGQELYRTSRDSGGNPIDPIRNCTREPTQPIGHLTLESVLPGAEWPFDSWQ